MRSDHLIRSGGGQINAGGVILQGRLEGVLRVVPTRRQDRHRLILRVMNRGGDVAYISLS